MLSYLIEAAAQASRDTDDFLLAYRIPDCPEWVIVDEVNRLKEAGIEQLRVMYNLARLLCKRISETSSEYT